MNSQTDTMASAREQVDPPLREQSHPLPGSIRIVPDSNRSCSPDPAMRRSAIAPPVSWKVKLP
jgi:hypothetical protein